MKLLLAVAVVTDHHLIIDGPPDTRQQAAVQCLEIRGDSTVNINKAESHQAASMLYSSLLSYHCLFLRATATATAGCQARSSNNVMVTRAKSLVTMMAT